MTIPYTHYVNIIDHNQGDDIKKDDLKGHTETQISESPFKSVK